MDELEEPHIPAIIQNDLPATEKSPEKKEGKLEPVPSLFHAQKSAPSAPNLFKATDGNGHACCSQY